MHCIEYFRLVLWPRRSRHVSRHPPQAPPACQTSHFFILFSSTCHRYISPHTCRTHDSLHSTKQSRSLFSRMQQSFGTMASRFRNLSALAGRAGAGARPFSTSRPRLEAGPLPARKPVGAFRGGYVSVLTLFTFFSRIKYLQGPAWPYAFDNAFVSRKVAN